MHAWLCGKSKGITLSSLTLIMILSIGKIIIYIYSNNFFLLNFVQFSTSITTSFQSVKTTIIFHKRECMNSLTIRKCHYNQSFRGFFLREKTEQVETVSAFHQVQKCGVKEELTALLISFRIICLSLVYLYRCYSASVHELFIRYSCQHQCKFYSTC